MFLNAASVRCQSVAANRRVRYDQVQVRPAAAGSIPARYGQQMVSLPKKEAPMITEPCKQSKDRQRYVCRCEGAFAIFKKWVNLSISIVAVLLAISDMWNVPGVWAIEAG